MDAPTLLEKYDRPAPRYTSFPTAVHFDQDISQSDYYELIASLSDEKPISLYVHIPFCHALCHYCGCNTKVVNSYSPVKAYVSSLLKEISMVGKALTYRLPISQLRFGGGSPNFLEASDFKDILKELGNYFDITQDTIIGIETDPRLLDKEKITAFIEAGVSSFSLGVQDFNKDVQRAVNREQSFKSIASHVKTLRDAKVESINFDLMVGLPLQTLTSLEETLAKAISLSPDRLAVFSYAHVPWMKKHQKLLEKYDLPDSAQRFDMTALVTEKLEAAGYHAIGIDHFARKENSLYKAQKEGNLRRNFQGYTDDQAQTILGFGLSSISCFQGAYVQNTTDAPSYRNKLKKGTFPIARGRILSEDDITRRTLIEGFMCRFKIDDIRPFPDALPHLIGLQQDGLLNIKDARELEVTPKGRPFIRIIASCFDPYFNFEEQHSRHAKAI